jgi:hypothetical protein
MATSAFFIVRKVSIVPTPTLSRIAGNASGFRGDVPKGANDVVDGTQAVVRLDIYDPAKGSVEIDSATVG